MESIFTEIRFCVADLKPGFAVITAYTQGKAGHLSGLGISAKVRDYLVKKGVGTVIRIAGKRQLVFHQITRIATKNNDYEVIYVSSREEAEKKLAEIRAAQSTT